MTKHVKWSSIEQFRNVVRNVQHKAQYQGMDADGNAIMDRNAKMPTLTFMGTVKLHGTNAGVSARVDDIQNLWAQSRENIITPMQDNAGFALFVEGQRENFIDLLTTAKHVHESHGAGYEYISVFGEWCGQGIQKGVAISELPKMFVIFGFAFSNEDGQKLYFNHNQIIDTIDGCREYVVKPSFGGEHKPNQMYSIYNFRTYFMDIDFENPHEAQNALNEITMAVEASCPVGVAFGVEGVGEGVVWHCTHPDYNDSGYWFKVKGDKHSNSKVKTLASVDVEKINNIKVLAEKLAHNGRLEQAVQNVFNTLNGGEVDPKGIGECIKWVMRDCFKEEMDTIAAGGFTGKELNGPISKIVRDYVMANL